MDAKAFDKLLDGQLSHVKQILGNKAAEYADDTDRLANFKTAAALQGIAPKHALLGMMAKHTVSIFDMAASDLEYPAFMWDEKITDHINYLILLRALVAEEIIENAKEAPSA